MPQKEPATPVPSSTVLVLRDGDGPVPLEVFMVVRHHQIDFASGALVFPGGKADTSDFDPDWKNHVRHADEFDDYSLGIRVAAIREAFEESGILLARNPDCEDLIDANQLASYDKQRDALNARELDFLDFIRTEGLKLASHQMQPFAHWITPKMMPKRFDTHFFLAAWPEGQVGVHDGSESVDSVWISPRQAIKEAEDGKRTIIFPTLMNLEMLAQSETVADAFAAARERTIVTVEPKLVDRDGAKVLSIPAEAGYSVTERPIDQMA